MSDDPRSPRTVPDPDERLSAYLDGELAGETRAELEAELAADPALRARVDALRRVDRALRALPPVPVPSELAARVRAQLAHESRSQAPGEARRTAAPRRTRAWRVAAAATLAAAGIAAVLVFGRSTPRAPAPPLARESGSGAGGTGSPALAPEAAPALPVDELELALELEQSADAGVVEVLDWLEAMDTLDPPEAG